jgi:hypothetical protein
MQENKNPRKVILFQSAKIEDRIEVLKMLRE